MHYLSLIFVFTLSSVSHVECDFRNNLAGSHWVDEQDMKGLSLVDLYEKIMLSRDYLKKGLTSDCLSLCKVTMSEYSAFPGADRYIGYLYSYKAQCYKRLGKLDMARAHFALTDYYANQQRDGSLELSNKINLASLENDCQNLLTAEKLLKNLLNYPDLDSYHSQREVILSNLAKTCTSLGNFQEAEDYFAELFQITGVKDVSGELDLPLLLRNYGSFLQRKGDIINAISFYKKALNLYSDNFSENHFQLGNTYKYLAEAYAEIDSSTKALDCYNESLRILRGIPSDKNNPGNDNQVSYETVLLQAISSYVAYIYTIILKQEKLISLEMAENASNMVKEAEGRINSFIRAQAPGSSVFILAGKVRPLFDAGIQCAMYLYDQTGNELWLQQAFEWFVRSKAYSLRILAEKEKMIYNEPGAGALFVKQKELLSGLNATSVADNQLNEGQMETLTATIIEYEINNDSLEKITARFINGETPGNSPHGNLIAKSKSWKQSLISYHLCNETAFVFILNNGRIDVERIIITEDLSESIERYKAILFSNRDAFYREAEVIEFENTGNQLYDRLLSPILKNSRSRSIIIQPDGILLGLPFGLMIRELQSTDVKPVTFRNLDYLMMDYEISYWMGLDAVLSDHEKKNKKSLIVTCSDETNNHGMFSEAKAFGGIRGLNSDIQLVDDYVSSEDLSAYGFLHFASHYSMNVQTPLKSGLVCIQDSEQPYLTLDEILSGSFPDSHVFINGCNTGNGSLNPGQGLSSMGLVFGISGANEVIAHLWTAEDQVSENLALDFYEKGIPGNYTKRLNRVKKEYLKNASTGFDHPHFWGGMVCSAKPTKKSPGYWCLVVLLAMVIFHLRFTRRIWDKGKVKKLSHKPNF